MSPCRPVPDGIQKPPYVNSKQPPGIASGPEVHDEKGIECMRASGLLAAKVLEYAGTLVKVNSSDMLTVYFLTFPYGVHFATNRWFRCLLVLQRY